MQQLETAQPAHHALVEVAIRSCRACDNAAPSDSARRQRFHGTAK
jgi:hypothetical protein